MAARKAAKTKRFAHVLLHVPAHDRARIAVHQQGQIEEVASQQRNVCDVAHPELIDSIRRRRVEEQVGVIAQGVSAVCCPRLKRLRLDRHKSQMVHQPAYAPPTASLLACRQFFRDPPRPVASFVFPENVTNHRHEPLIVMLSLAKSMPPPGVIRRTTDAKRFAQ
jgi:hypothetical protein